MNFELMIRPDVANGVSFALIPHYEIGSTETRVALASQTLEKMLAEQMDEISASAAGQHAADVGVRAAEARAEVSKLESELATATAASDSCAEAGESIEAIEERSATIEGRLIVLRRRLRVLDDEVAKAKLAADKEYARRFERAGAAIKTHVNNEIESVRRAALEALTPLFERLMTASTLGTLTALRMQRIPEAMRPLDDVSSLPALHK